MKKTDVILIGTIALVALIGYIVLSIILNRSTVANGTATIFYNDDAILRIHLIDGTYDILDNEFVVSIDDENFIYIVQGTNGDVVIEYRDNRVRVIDEISPQNICQVQGWSSSPLSPITCLPNNVIIIIEGPKSDSDPDVITG